MMDLCIDSVLNFQSCLKLKPQFNHQLSHRKENTIDQQQTDQRLPSKATKAKQYLSYEPTEGAFYVLKKGEPFRKIFPDEYGYLIFYMQRVKYKVKANRIAFELGNDTELPEGKSVLHRNMNYADFRLKNLIAVPNAVYRRIKEAYRNLSGGMKILPHKTDVFCYVLHYREGNQDRFQVLHDIVLAKQRYLAMQLKFAKVINRWCIFDE